MFARKLNQSVKPIHVYKPKNNANQLVPHPQDILSIFSKFYSEFLSKPSSSITHSTIMIG